MLFGYPASATANNWLHECLLEIIKIIHTGLREGQPLLEWPDIIPDSNRNRLRRRTSLRDPLKSYQQIVEALSKSDQERVLTALNEQNEISRLLSCACNCETIDDLPEAIREPIKTLFTNAYNLLTDFEIRDDHYQAIYKTIPHPVCPFCGYEFFDGTKAPREDLDHYLKKSTYPFAAANLQNLVPMGGRCNSAYKGVKDILRRNDGTRRKAFNPYDHIDVKISLENSRPFAGIDAEQPLWQVDFEPDCEEIETWDDVFEIRKRYVRDALEPSFKRWLGNFGSWVKSNYDSLPSADEELLLAIQEYIRNLKNMESTGHDFLREYVFQMLLKHCQQGNQRLLALVRDILPNNNPVGRI